MTDAVTEEVVLTALEGEAKSIKQIGRELDLICDRNVFHEEDTVAKMLREIRRDPNKPTIKLTPDRKYQLVDQQNS